MAIDLNKLPEEEGDEVPDPDPEEEGDEVLDLHRSTAERGEAQNDEQQQQMHQGTHFALSLSLKQIIELLLLLCSR